MINPKIKTPCHENWDNMKLRLNARFCEKCEKNVIDFTNKSRIEIIEYLLKHQQQKTCGRFYRHQLDTSTHDYLVTIQESIKKNPKSNRSFFLLALTSLLLASCEPSATNQTTPIKVEQTVSNLAQKPIENFGLLDTIQQAQNDTSKLCTTTKDSTSEIESISDSLIIPSTMGIIEMGDIDIGSESDTIPVNTSYNMNVKHQKDSVIYTLVEKMPEFVGGVDSLYRYLGNNLVYPKNEYDLGNDVTVYVSFVIDRYGKTNNITILRNTSKDKTIESIVEKVILDMPLWSPGKQRGQAVNVRYTLPIRFKLD